MEAFTSALLGFLSGLIYNEHIYQQAVRFPRKDLRFSFWVRFLPLALLMTFVGTLFGPEGLLYFLVLNLTARFLHTVFRSFVAVR
ncbi:MAG: hypothetical protein Q9N26_07020 [Aquificota bacterium]|nr:hypothetical protein [Aquificota bacterium]